jgi:hypothetical protein
LVHVPQKHRFGAISDLGSEAKRRAFLEKVL